MRILVADDHQIVRRGVRSLLESSGLDVCGEAVDGRDAIQKALDLKPDAIVMDVSMPNANGLDATREIRRLLPDVQIIMLSQHDSPEMKRQAFAAGAQGYVVKSAIAPDLLGALARISQRDLPLLPAVVAEEVPNVDVQELLQRTSAFEAALRQSEQQVRSLVAYQSAVMNSMAEGLCALDARGFVTSINPAGESILGWTKEELVGRKMHEVTHYKHPDGTPFPACECPGLRVIEAGTSLREHEDVFIRKDGAFVPVILSASPLKQDGKTAGVILCFRDDAEQRKARAAVLAARQELEVATAHLQLVTNTMAASVARCSRDLRYLWVNQRFADWLQRPLEEINGRLIREVLGEETFLKLLPHFESVLSGSKVVYEHELTFDRIAQRYVSAAYTPTFDSTGVPDGWVAVLWEIKERKPISRAESA